MFSVLRIAHTVAQLKAATNVRKGFILSRGIVVQLSVLLVIWKSALGV